MSISQRVPKAYNINIKRWGTHCDALRLEAERGAERGRALGEYRQHGVSIPLRQPLQPLQAGLQPAPILVVACDAFLPCYQAAATMVFL